MMFSTFKAIHDFTHLVGPLTEESLVKCLQARFYSGQYQTWLGPQLVCVNPFTQERRTSAFPRIGAKISCTSDSISNHHSNTTINSSSSRSREGYNSPQAYVPSEDGLHRQSGHNNMAESRGQNQAIERQSRVDGAPSSSMPSSLESQGGKSRDRLEEFVRSLLMQHTDSCHPQVVLVSGENGSGKSHCATNVIHHLMDMAGGGNETDAFKFLDASLTVINSLATACTPSNSHSSRIGMYFENLTSDGIVYRTKIHCLFVDANRINHVPKGERNYHIFYEMLAGLGREERVKLHLNDFGIGALAYLGGTSSEYLEEEHKVRFLSWKSSLAVLGIPVIDVLRVLSSVMLLGNVQFTEGLGQELEILGNNELKSVAALLGVSGLALYRGFTTQTRMSHGQVCRTITDASLANNTRDSLARALYCRTVTAILRRINSMKVKPSQGTGTVSSESIDSRGFHQMNNKPDILNPPMSSFFGLSLSKKASESFIGILDLFGFEIAEVNRLEQLCINLCAEAMQHYYNTHVFRSPNDALLEEGILSEVEVSHFDNTPVIELLSAQNNGLLNILDFAYKDAFHTPKEYVNEIKSHHIANNYFFEPLPKHDHLFGIRHFTSRVVYDASSFLSSNRDEIRDDIIHVFSKQNCNFGFVSYLFAPEIKDGAEGPNGTRFRTYSLTQSDSDSHEEVPVSLAKDFQLKLENILKSMANAKPNFIRCIKSNDQKHPGVVDCESVTRQVRSLQLREAVQLMAGGLPHRLRFKVFNHRYRLFIAQYSFGRFKIALEECKVILDQFLRTMDESQLPYISTQWSLGRKHIFYSEGTRQSLEVMRFQKLHQAAKKIQSAWKEFKCHRVQRSRRKVTNISKNEMLSNLLQPVTPRPQLPPKGEKIEKMEPAILSYVCELMEIDLLNPPPTPPKRNYLIHGNVQISYPQSRCMKAHFLVDGTVNRGFRKGEIVTVLGPSSTKGYLMVQKGEMVHHVPFNLTAIQRMGSTSSMDI